MKLNESASNISGTELGGVIEDWRRLIDRPGFAAHEAAAGMAR